jgi:signal peptidase II
MKKFLIKFQIQFLAIVLASMVIVIDRVTEQVVLSYIRDNSEIIRIAPFFNLVWVGNEGISFGILQGLPYGQYLISVFALMITGFFFMWLLRSRSLWMGCALGLIIGGAVGNTIERLMFGHVIDVLDFHVAGYHWPAFNLTDSAIFIGVVLIVFYELFRKPNKHAGQEGY